MSADNSNNWIADTVGDFIHSPIWAAPVHTFIEARCAAFDYDDENIDEENRATSSTISLEEQMNIHEEYTRLVDALIHSLGQDLGLNQDDLNKVCQIPTDDEESVVLDESYEQLYAARDFPLFQEMMRRKNLILQLQALVSLQLQWGLLKQSDTGDDLVLSLLMQATSSPSSTVTAQRQPIAHVEQPVVKQEVPQKTIQIDYDDDDDVVSQRPSPSVSKSTHQKKEKKQPKKPIKEEIHLPDLRRRGGDNLDTDWYRNLRQNVSQKSNKNDDDDDDDDVSHEHHQSKKSFTPQSIGAVPQDVLREKLRELTDQTSLVDEKAATAIRERKNFLQQQRDAIVEKQRIERAQNLEQETKQQEQQTSRPARPQSAALARKAMVANQNTQQQTQIPDEELNKRRAMAAKLRREVVDKR